MATPRFCLVNKEYRLNCRPLTRTLRCEEEFEEFATMPRLVRRKPFYERIKDFLNPGDLLLWLSEEFETRDWDSKQVGTPLALGLHLVILLARANSASSYGKGRDDVFGDYDSGSSWLSYIVSCLHCK